MRLKTNPSEFTAVVGEWCEDTGGFRCHQPGNQMCFILYAQLEAWQQVAVDLLDGDKNRAAELYRKKRFPERFTQDIQPEVKE